GAGNLDYGGTADTGAPAGKAGTLLLDPKNLVIDAVAGVFPQFDFVDPHPTTGAFFGASVTVLSTGNVVVANAWDNVGGTKAGATYLYDGLTGALLSSLVGSNANDQVGSGVTALSNGNYVVKSENWNGNRGAATWGSGTVGVTGVVSEANSLVGSNANDYVDDNGVAALSNGNYVATRPWWQSAGGEETGGDRPGGGRIVVAEAQTRGL